MDSLVEQLRDLVLPALQDGIEPESGDTPNATAQWILATLHNQLFRFPWDRLRLPEVDLEGGKSDQESREFRESGNREFVSGNLDQALFWYNQAIVHAEREWPGPEESTLGLGYGNRAQVFTALALPHWALVDLNRAIALSKSGERRKKLLLRKLALLTTMARYAEARQVVDELAGHALAGDEEKLLAQCIDQLDEKQELLELNTLNIVNADRRFRQQLKELRVPWLMQNDRALLATALQEELCSFAFDAQVSPEGYTVNSGGQVKKGQLLCVERPVALLAQSYETHCARCLKALHRVPLVSCRQCTKWLYCSEPCESMAWAEWHRVECRNTLLDHLDLRSKVMLRALAQCRDFGSLCQLLSPSDSSNELLQNDSSKMKALVKLFTAPDYKQADHYKLISVAIQANLLIRILQDCPSFQNYENDAHWFNLEACCALVRGLLCLDGYIEPIGAVYSFQEDLDHKLLGSDLLDSSGNLERHTSPLALAFYYSSTLLECAPVANTRIAFNGTCKAIRARQSLAPGTKLTREECFNKANFEFATNSTKQWSLLEQLTLHNELARNHLEAKNYGQAAEAGGECLHLINTIQREGRFDRVKLDHLYTVALVKLARAEFEYFTERDLAIGESVRVADRCFVHCSEALGRINAASVPLELVAALENAASGEQQCYEEVQCFNNIPVMAELEDMLVACDMFTKQFAGVVAQPEK